MPSVPHLECSLGRRSNSEKSVRRRIHLRRRIHVKRRIDVRRRKRVSIKRNSEKSVPLYILLYVP